MIKSINTRISIKLNNKIKKISKELNINNILSSELIATEPKFKIVQIPRSKKIEIIQTIRLKLKKRKKGLNGNCR